MVSGSGLAVDLGEPLFDAVPLADWLPFPVHEVVGHPHSLELLRTRSDRTVLYQRGRLHSYQGYDANETVFAVRLAALLGARALVMTNAAGGLHPHQAPGDLVLIRDQINLSGLNPLRGEPPESWGPRFPDMVGAHDDGLRALAHRLAAEVGLELGEGVYAAVAGPSYETPAEIEMLRRIGADLVGMSTVLEVIAARHMGVRCLCLSLVSNLAAGVGEGELHHDEVIEAGRLAAGGVRRLLRSILAADELG
jgi:purine-nucleoside phosphorylase